ncbi:alpha-amylase family protein [Deinococcus multiflagellatus]|uniref:alpha-amylase family protein n=1 Tax=Deinococcus multiflagellatus TaxID=1656887 RepID=UPI001CC95CD8|nr:alpha-amylase family protein [Deinococcus multiflagellatus]MBZ9712571.1 alpha-amylase family protein [Deinococcus multiflagellatus]
MAPSDPLRLLAPDSLRRAFDDDRDADTFLLRLERYGPELIESLGAVYGEAATEALLPELLEVLLHAYHTRPADLKRLDEARLLRPDWLQQPEMIGYVAYADRFAGTLKGVQARVPYLEGLGVKYLHLMPLLKPRAGENDGGYAVADYRAVREDLGSMDDLSALAADLRRRGISLVLDLVLNHVAQEHEWAHKARAGDPIHRDYFHLFPDRTVPDAYERTLPEIFPDFAPGNFTWNEEARSWVWTTFNAYQWDLNWANPAVLREFVDIILHLANRGVEVFRLDAIAFLWKRPGTDCQNQPEVHHLTRAMRACARIAAPAVAFKAEAIVAPGDLIHYLGTGGHHGRVSDMAYHNSLMVQLWSSLASRDTRLFEAALRAFPPKPTNTTWGMYVRCHDDIGWAISDLDAARVGLSGPAHRHFLSDFYSGEFPGTFARGLVFQHNPQTGDRRISGSAASLAGLEAALAAGDPRQIDLAVRRLLLLHAVTLGFGGVPLLYMGDELALLNDHDFAATPEHAPDNRWVHRPRMDWARAEAVAADASTPHGRVNAGLRRQIAARQGLAHLHASIESRPVPSPDPCVLLLRRDHPLGTFVGVYNFSEHTIHLPASALREHLGEHALDHLAGSAFTFGHAPVVLDPYRALWLTQAP